MHLTEKAITENFDLLFYLEGRNAAGEPIWCYVTVAPDEVETFLEQSALPGFRPGQYATIVVSGTGEPTDEEKDRLEDELGLERGVL
ncbi:MAG: hypothetical protein KJ017_05115 [Alphaproteobacteria bacterium]|nr:hypothetical protein [Alphaproteobacteria bacterium]